MAKTVKYPVGIQTFRKIREDNNLYVDKTGYIPDLINDSKYIFLNRPRRFGKSLFMSTLEAYFKGERELFEGLEISRTEKEWLSYPVFRFDLSPGYFNDVTRLKDRLNGCLREIERRYALSAEDGNEAERFMNLIRQAVEITGRKVVILIDEYDKPLLDCLHDETLHEQIKGELRGFYSVLKASDEYIRFAMLTGVTKFGKVSVFSGLNNLKDISMLPKYNGICGISESEFRRDFVKSVEEFSAVSVISKDEVWKEFKRWYDGYHFARTGENIYNPFSVLNAFDSEEIKSYWFASGSPSYLINLIKRYGFILSDLEGEWRRESSLSDISEVSRDFVPLLYQSGYLTIKGYDGLSRQYKLGFPNREVYEGFWESLADYFFSGYGGRPSFDLFKFLEEVNSGEAERFMLRLQSLFADTDSEAEMNKEIHFQNMMAIVCKMLGLAVRTEVHLSRGRCDMQIETAANIYIFEFKINGNAQDALQQIKEKG
ncbi:MAG: ATP-binding protein, partial [Muribaculaceae bacterium]|nr:ATP-binding protein [Muribaculaceae bacterium]